MSNLFGLKNNSKIKIFYDVKNDCVSKHEGIDEKYQTIAISEEKVFDLPLLISVNEIPFYPTKYEIFNSGEVVYASNRVPVERIKLIGVNDLFDQTKERKFTVKLPELISIPKKRIRKPNQIQVMGISASKHVENLIKNGKIEFDNIEPISWHWCHLIAFSLLPENKAQKKSNLVCGTAACNGHMANIETAIKKFVYEYKRPLGLEVLATTYRDTLVARRIRYRIFDKKGSKLSHSEYFDALTDIKSDTADYKLIYNRMLKLFEDIPNKIG